MIAFTIDGIEMNTGLRDANGALWFVTETQGWFDTPDFRQAMLDLANDHGSKMASSVMDKRRVQIAGVCRVQGTEADLWKTRDRLVSAMTTFTGTKTITVTEYGIQKQMAYWAAGGASITPTPGGFEFSFTLVMEDPRKYSPTTTTVSNIATGANANVVIFGGYQTPPTFVVNNIASNANTANITITNTVGGSVIGTLQLLTYAAPVGENKVVFDTANRTVRGMNAANGNVTNRYGSLNTASLVWFDLMPGVNNVLAFTGTGYTLTPSYRDAWL